MLGMCQNGLMFCRERYTCATIGGIGTFPHIRRHYMALSARASTLSLETFCAKTNDGRNHDGAMCTRAHQRPARIGRVSMCRIAFGAKLLRSHTRTHARTPRSTEATPDARHTLPSSLCRNDVVGVVVVSDNGDMSLCRRACVGGVRVHVCCVFGIGRPFFRIYLVWVRACVRAPG